MNVNLGSKDHQFRFKKSVNFCCVIMMCLFVCGEEVVADAVYSKETY